jgi:hypothetical protein
VIHACVAVLETDRLIILPWFYNGIHLSQNNALEIKLLRKSDLMCSVFRLVVCFITVTGKSKVAPTQGRPKGPRHINH